MFHTVLKVWNSYVIYQPRNHFGDSWRQYFPIAIEGLWEMIAIICDRIFVRYFVKSFDNNTALKRLSINGHFL